MEGLFGGGITLGCATKTIFRYVLDPTLTSSLPSGVRASLRVLPVCSGGFDSAISDPPNLRDCGTDGSDLTGSGCENFDNPFTVVVCVSVQFY